MRMGRRRTGYSCVRRSLCCLNLIFWLVSCVLLGAGLWLRLSDRLESRSAYLSAGALCLGAAVVALVLAFLGCCGAWFHSKKLLAAYFSLLVVLFVLELVAGTLGFFFRHQVSATLREELKAGIGEYFVPGSGVSYLWDHIQRKFSCCGVEGVEDWLRARHPPPESCCRATANVTSATTLCHGKWHHTGCLRRIQGWLLERLYLVAAVCISLAFVQLFGLVAALLLACTVSHRRTTLLSHGLRCNDQ